jgi:pimeloyl-ACP methyl ester carboxylesterase
MRELISISPFISLSLASVVSSAVVGCGSEPLTRQDDGTTLVAEQQDVSFLSGGLTLVGTLTLPSHRSTERVPGVVLVAGSGPLSRDEVLTGQLGMSFGFELPVLEMLASALTDAGFATLRYDKRSCGPFNNCADNGYPAPSDSLTIDDFVSDVQAALDFLDGVAEIDPTSLSVIGHSEGATYVPPLLETRGDLRSAIMLAAPYHPIDEILAQQAERLKQLLTEEGVSAATISTDLASLDEELAALAMMRAGDYDGGFIGGAYPPFWTSLMSLGDADPATSLLVDRPVLAIGGGYDWNVPPPELALWQRNFASSSNPDQRAVVTLDCMTHALNCIAQPDYHLISAADIAQTLHPDLVPTIVTFLRSH